MNRVNLTERVINVFVAIEDHPQTEFMAQVQMPARPLRRRASVAVIDAEIDRIEQENIQMNENDVVRNKSKQIV